jgi:hypothetical protein
MLIRGFIDRRVHFSDEGAPMSITCGHDGKKNFEKL